MVLTWHVCTEDGWTCPRTRSQAVPTPLTYASPPGTLVTIGSKAWQALFTKWVTRCTNRYVHPATVRIIANRTLFMMLATITLLSEIARYRSSRRMDCCRLAVYYLVTHTITSLNILSIYWLLLTRHNAIKPCIYRVEIRSTITCRCPSPFQWGSMRASRCYGNVWSSRWLLAVLTLLIFHFAHHVLLS